MPTLSSIYMPWDRASQRNFEARQSGKITLAEYLAEADRLNRKYDADTLRAELGTISDIAGVPFNIDAVVA